MSILANSFPMISNMVWRDLNHHTDTDNTSDRLLYFRLKPLAIMTEITDRYAADHYFNNALGRYLQLTVLYIKERSLFISLI